MANPTTYFGWVMPTTTDLVTDLPADFNVFGQGVDTSMQGLLGGTTGQVLSKTSGTNMSFTWINNDTGDITGVTAGTGISGGGTSGTVTVTNSMATAIDAKGDLVAGTGADAFSRLAVGSNNTVLTADSAEATGLKWATASASGKIAQVVQGTTTTTTSSTSTSYVNTSLSVTITPSAATSKILLITSASGQVRGASNVNFSDGYYALANNTTKLSEVEILWFNVKEAAVNVQDIRTPVAITYLDSPATTNATTYRLRIKVGAGASAGDTVFTIGDQTLIAMEVLA